MWFLRLRPFALSWKSFELVSPTLIQVNLDHCRILILSIAAKPNNFFFSRYLKSLSSSVSILSSWARSRWKISSVATLYSSLDLLDAFLFHFFSALAVLDNLV
uniref:Uncharacterized protein n=1 Tax=Triticum urartu TaxID=4572 RepID=A0A8R7P9G3_TRIUA